jgi:hypothetical protein
MVRHKGKDQGGALIGASRAAVQEQAKTPWPRSRGPEGVDHATSAHPPPCFEQAMGTDESRRAWRPGRRQESLGLLGGPALRLGHDPLPLGSAGSRTRCCLQGWWRAPIVLRRPAVYPATIS